MSDSITTNKQEFCNSAIILNYLIQKKISNETGNRSLLEVLYQYPQVALAEYHYSYQTINQHIESEILDRFYKNYNTMVLQVNDFTNPAYLSGKQETISWLPLTADVTYQIPYNNNKILSVLFQEFLWFGGAHPSTEQFSFTYDLCSGRELTAKELLGVTEKEVKERIANGFEQEYKKNPEKYFPEEIKRLKTLNFTYDYYLTDQGVMVYFNPYAIGPYVSGILTLLL